VLSRCLLTVADSRLDQIVGGFFRDHVFGPGR
jgi:hypothetical protein